VDGQGRIVPKNAVFVGRGIVITTFVKKLNGFCESQKTVSKTGGDVDLIVGRGGQADAGPFAKMRRPEANVHGNVQNFAIDHPTELGLRVEKLIVKAAERSLGRSGVVILKEAIPDSEIREFRVVVRFEERAARISMDYRAQLTNTWQRGFDSFHVQSILRMSALAGQS